MEYGQGCGQKQHFQVTEKVAQLACTDLLPYMCTGLSFQPEKTALEFGIMNRKAWLISEIPQEAKITFYLCCGVSTLFDEKSPGQQPGQQDAAGSRAQRAKQVRVLKRSAIPYAALWVINVKTQKIVFLFVFEDDRLSIQIHPLQKLHAW